jgi:peptidyl-prolyl cis-trans isomerase SurA
MDFAMPRINVGLRPFRRWLAGLALALVLGLPVAAGAQVVVVANGSPITAYDIEQRTKLIATSTHKTPTRQEVVNELINDRIKIAKAKSYGLEVTDKDVDNAFGVMAQRQHITPQQFTQFLQHLGISSNTVKARIRAEITWNQLIRGKFGPSLQVSDSDIASALRARNENESSSQTMGFIYTLYPVMVVVPRISSRPVMEAKLREAESLRAQFVSCKEGLALARSLRDVAVREPITRSSADLAQQLRDLLGNMPMGHLTPPEVTAQGLQMFALCGKKETKADSPIKRQLRDQLFAQRFEAESKRYLEEIRKSAMIEYTKK